MARCIDCGRLWMQTNDPPFRILATIEYRKLGEFNGEVSSGAPICHRSHPIQADYEQHRENGMAPDEAVMAVTKCDRDCPDWIRWIDGYDPKECERMIAIEIAEKARDSAARAEAEVARAEKSISAVLNGINLTIAVAGLAIATISIGSSIAIAIFAPVIQHWLGIK